MQNRRLRKSPKPTLARIRKGAAGGGSAPPRSAGPGRGSSQGRAALARKLERLERAIARCGSALVAFSGGVDSTFLLSVARDVLEDRVIAATVAFPAVPVSEVRAARALARALGVRHLVLRADDLLAMKKFSGNPPDRCYHCKKAILSKLGALAGRRGLACVLEASNADDARDFRPGGRAVRELGVRSPLVEARISKSDIRALSRERGLPTWDKPSAACLASRIPYGEKITKARLSRIERGEAALAEAGFAGARLRDHGGVARIEVGAGEIARLLDGPLRAKLAKKLKALGFRYVAVDIEGYRTGSLNEGLRGRKRAFLTKRA